MPEVTERALIPLRRKAWYAALVVAVAFGLFEGVLWMIDFPSYHALMWHDSTGNEDQQEARHFLRDHYQTLGRGEPIAGTSAWHYVPFESEFLSVNGLGFRGSMPPRRKLDEFRVAVFGGSSVYGWLVADDQTLPACLENELRRHLGDRPVTVINLGVEGYRFQQEVELAELMWPALDADLLLFVHGANDVTTTLRHGWTVDKPWGATSVMPPLVANYDKPGVAGRLRSLLKYSRTATIPLLGALRFRAGSDGTALGQPLPTDLLSEANEMVKGWERLFERTAALAEVSGVSVVTVMQPTLSVKRPLSRYERARLLRTEKGDPGIGPLSVAFSKMVEATGSQGVPIIDLTEIFSGNQQTVFQDWVHLTAEGNRILAKALAKRVDGL